MALHDSALDDLWLLFLLRTVQLKLMCRILPQTLGTTSVQLLKAYRFGDCIQGSGCLRGCLQRPDRACLHACSFHGKDPSKNKKDKRFRKIAEEQERKRRTMSAIGEDHALSRLAAVQEQSATPYLVRTPPNTSPPAAGASKHMQSCVSGRRPRAECHALPGVRTCIRETSCCGGTHRHAGMCCHKLCKTVLCQGPVDALP